MRKQNKPKEKFTNRREYTFGLVDKAFHIFDADGKVHAAGVVKAIVGDDKALVQYCDFLTQEPATLEIVFINEMVTQADKKERWQFYEDIEHLNFWYKYRYFPEPQLKVEAVPQEQEKV